MKFSYNHLSRHTRFLSLSLTHTHTVGFHVTLHAYWCSPQLCEQLVAVWSNLINSNFSVTKSGLVRLVVHLVIRWYYVSKTNDNL